MDGLRGRGGIDPQVLDQPQAGPGVHGQGRGGPAGGGMGRHQGPQRGLVVGVVVEHSLGQLGGRRRVTGGQRGPGGGVTGLGQEAGGGRPLHLGPGGIGLVGQERPAVEGQGGAPRPGPRPTGRR